MNEMRRVIREQHEQSLVALNDIARKQRIDLENTEKEIERVRAMINSIRIQEATERRNNENEIG